jgi:hypothetical protein
MHEREFPNPTAASEHGTGHGSAASDTHPDDGGAHAPENTHGGDGHGQRHPETNTSERTDVMKTTNKTTSTGAALTMALFLILSGGATTSAFTVQGQGGEEFAVFCGNEGGGYDDQQGGAIQVIQGGDCGGGTNVTGKDGSGEMGDTGGEDTLGGGNIGGGIITGGGDGTPFFGGNYGAGGFVVEGAGGMVGGSFIGGGSFDGGGGQGGSGGLGF